MEEIKEEIPPANLEEIERAPAASSISGLVFQLHNVMLDARDLIHKYHLKHQDLEYRHASVSNRENEIKAINDSFSSREAACRKVENIQQVHANNIAMQKDYAQRLNILEEEEKKHLSAVENFRKEILEERSLNQREASAVLTQRKNIDQEVAKRVQTILQSMGLTTPVETAPGQSAQ